MDELIECLKKYWAIWLIGILLIIVLCSAFSGCDDEDQSAVMLGGGSGGTAQKTMQQQGTQLMTEVFGQSQPVSGITITDFGYPNDFTPDNASANGIGNHDNQMTAYFNGNTVASAALSNDVAQELGLKVGQQFVVTADSGQQYTLSYDDTAPENGRIDIYTKSSSALGGNSFSQKAISIKPVTFQ